MKRFSAILAAALIALSVSVPAFAEPDTSPDESSAAVQSSAEESKNEEESKDAESSEKTQESSSPESSGEKTAESSTEQAAFKSYRIEKLGMSIDIPSDMYVLTPGMDENDPTFEACRLTKEEVEKSFKESGTELRAYVKDFSYDITIQVSENDRTKAIDNLTTLADAEVENVIKSLISSEYASGCSKTTFNNTLYLTLDTKYTANDSEIFGKQEYTIIKGCNLIISLQSYDGPITQDMEKLLAGIMKSVVFDGVGMDPIPTDLGNQTVSGLDIRYVLLMVSSVIAIIALAAIIIVAVRYRHSGEEEEEEEITDVDYEQPPVRPNGILIEEKPAKEEKKETDNIYKNGSMFAPADENVIYKNEKLDEEKKKKEEYTPS